MASPFIGEIRMFGGNYAPVGWAFCDGQLFSTAEHPSLFSLIGTTYGGNGETTFALPDLRGRVPLGSGQSTAGGNYQLGQSGGVEQVTITAAQLPGHTHAPQCYSGNGSSTDPTNNFWASQPALLPYSDIPATSNMKPGILQSVGGSQPHDNMIPYVGIYYIIALEGVFPSQQ